MSGACTVKTPDEGTPAGGSGGEAANPKGGSGGTSGHAGSSASSKGGKSGTAGRGGSEAVGAAAGADAEGGSGGAPECPGCSSGFCLEDGTCVDCVGSNDQCPDGQYCTEANACAPGCKANGTSCVSGVCGEDHNCQSCISDDECVAPLVCSHGGCSEPCTAEQEGQTASCAEDLLCCSLHCTHVMTDSQHCGACGNSCDAGQFCGLTSCATPEDPASCVTCRDTTLTNVCAIANIVVLLDTSQNEQDGNRVVGRSIGAALASQCATQPVVTEAEQDSVDALNFKTGRPVSGGGELLVVAGGPYYQVLEGYLEDERISPLYWHLAGDKTEFRQSANDAVVASLPIDGEHLDSDYFIIQFMRDAASGSLVLNAQGMWLSGTVAAAHQLTYGMLPDLSTVDQAWYAYEWIDANGDRAPSLDEMHLIDSGT